MKQLTGKEKLIDITYKMIEIASPLKHSLWPDVQKIGIRFDLEYVLSPGYINMVFPNEISLRDELKPVESYPITDDEYNQIVTRIYDKYEEARKLIDVVKDVMIKRNQK